MQQKRLYKAVVALGVKVISSLRQIQKASRNHCFVEVASPGLGEKQFTTEKGQEQNPRVLSRDMVGPWLF